MIKAILIDLDNTLIETQALYDYACNEALEYICARAAQPVDPQQVMADIQQSFVDQLHKKGGYSISIAPDGLEQALFLHVPTASKEEVEAVRAIGNEIFYSIAEVKEGVAEAIERLSQHFPIYVVTAGEEIVQRRRINSLSFKSSFTDIFVHFQKDRNTYINVVTMLGYNPGEVVMIGDSLKSDIIPAVEAGLQAIYIEADNWRAVEADNYTLPAKRASSFRDLGQATSNLISQCKYRSAAKRAAVKRHKGMSF